MRDIEFKEIIGNDRLYILTCGWGTTTNKIVSKTSITSRDNIHHQVEQCTLRNFLLRLAKNEKIIITNTNEEQLIY